MFKKLIIFSFFIFTLIGCGTDYYYSSFYLRKDLAWPVSPSQQANLSTYMTIASSVNFNTYTSPSVIATPANYILTIYEVRNNPNFNKMLGVDGNDVVNVKLNISLDAQTFREMAVTIGESASSAKDSKGSPIAFLNRDSSVVVLAIGGVGLSDGNDQSESIIYKSKSTNNGYDWSNWEKLEDSVFEPLSKDGYNRYYTNPGNGITLRNGTLACMIDFRKSGSGANPDGAAILYSTDGGESWKIGGKMMYGGNYRSARIIAERKDGKLLIAAVSSPTSANYQHKGALKWGIADTRDSDIKSFSVTGLPEVNSAGTVSGGRITLVNTNNNRSADGILLLHSGPDRPYTGPNGLPYTVVNSSSVSVSEDEGQTWTTITNIVGTQYKDRASFRQSLFVLKDGTLALALEEGNSYQISSSSGEHFVLVLRRISLSALSEGTYIYEGL